MTLTGIPCASTRRWCLLPALRRSVGFGPLFFPHGQRVPTNCRQRHGKNRACRHLVICPAVRGGAFAIRRPFARLAPGASTSCQSRTPFLVAAFPKEFLTAKQTGCPSVRAYHPAACGQDASCAAA